MPRPVRAGDGEEDRSDRPKTPPNHHAPNRPARTPPAPKGSRNVATGGAARRRSRLTRNPWTTARVVYSPRLPPTSVGGYGHPRTSSRLQPTSTAVHLHRAPHPAPIQFTTGAGAPSRSRQRRGGGLTSPSTAAREGEAPAEPPAKPLPARPALPSQRVVLKTTPPRPKPARQSLWHWFVTSGEHRTLPRLPYFGHPNWQSSPI